MRSLAKVEDNFQPDICWEFEVHLGRKKLILKLSNGVRLAKQAWPEERDEANYNSTTTVPVGGSRHFLLSQLFGGRFPF